MLSLIFKRRKRLRRDLLKTKEKKDDPLLAICCVCGKIRVDDPEESFKDLFLPMAEFMYKKLKILFTTTYCPDCLKREKEKYSLM